MSVFICWSGTRSHEIARAVETLLINMAVPKDQVFVSDQIEKGAAWFDSILDKLQGAQVGIVCLTSENLASPWMHFEAGAFARGLSSTSIDFAQSADSSRRQTGTATDENSKHRSRLFTVLHGVTAAEIKGPLSAYQTTSTTQQEMSQLVGEIKHILDDTDKAKVSRDRNQTRKKSAQKGELTHGERDFAKGIPNHIWETFERALEHATVPVGKLISDFDQTFQRKTFNEPLHHCADQAWLARYEGARLTREALLPRLNQVRAACPHHEQELFELLLSELDGYAMALQALLLKPIEFKLDSVGELEMDEGIQTCCEDRRLAIKSIATRLLHPLDDPLTDEAVRFMAAETNEERKMIVHRLEARIRQTWEQVHEDGSKEPERRSAIDNAALGKLVAGMLERQINSAPAQEPKSTKPIQRLLQFRESSWDLDRIYYYLLIRYFGTAALRWESSHLPATSAIEQQSEDYDLACAARDVEMEVERYRARSKGGSLMPLTYALIALKALCSRPAHSAEELGKIKSAFTLVREELGKELKTEPGRPIERLLAEIL